MKKALFIIVTILIIGFLAYVLINTSNNSTPKYSTTTSRNVQILKIHQNEFQTRIDFKVNAVRFKPNGFKISAKDTYIQNSIGGVKINVQDIEGLIFDETYLDTIFENLRYTLVFPPLQKSIETIDFISDNTKVYDIELSSQKHSFRIPKELKGNWLKTDGSNQWMYGFYDNVIIYDNEFWNDFQLEKKGRFYSLILKKDGLSQTIYLKKDKNNALLIGNDTENLKPYSRNKTIKKDYQLKAIVEVDSTIFKEGVAIYKGYIKDYHQKMNWEIKVYAPNVITNEYHEYVFKVNNDGTFYAEVPMNYAEKTFVRIGNISEIVFLEPEKTTVQFIDLEEHNAPYKNIKQQINHKRKALFMGDLARLNNDMKSLEHIRYRFESNFSEKILNMSASQYKEYYLDIMKKELDSLKIFVKDNPISQQAQKIKEMEISYRTSADILSYESNMRGSRLMKQRRDKTDKDFDKKNKIPVKEDLTPAYYDFLDKTNMNNSASLMLGSDYYLLINRVRFPSIDYSIFQNYFDILINNIEKRGISLSKEHENMLNRLLKCKTKEELKANINKDGGKLWNSFKDKYSSVYTESIHANSNRVSAKNRKFFYGLNEGFATEIIFSQEMASIIKTNFEPLNSEHLKDIDVNISNENIKRVLFKHNKIKAMEFSKNIENVDYYVHETPDVKMVDLFDTILESYKGKAVFVDFWATWCGPCLLGIERVKPFKEKLKNEAIEFVYITNTTSPLLAYEKAVPGIKGNHYRLTKKQWEYLQIKFLITGIPHYLFVDKEGNIIKDNLHSPFISGEFEKLLSDYF